MNDLNLGQIITTEQQRDAVHIAVAPVIAARSLQPGQRIEFVDGSTDTVKGSIGVGIGIVDPFLTRDVGKGDRFWAWLTPGSITSLRHNWTHPAFTTAVQASDKASDDARHSETWLRAYAMRIKPYENPDEAYRNLIKGLKTREVFAHGTDLCGVGDLPDASELRHHAEKLLGICINWDDFSFSCSC